MDAFVKPSASEIRRAREENPKIRERDLALQLGVSEAEFVAAWCGDTVRRVAPRVSDVLNGLEAVGEVMALTRNESAVHEKIGVYDKVVTGEQNALVLSKEIDLRIFPKVWAHGFWVQKHEGEEVRHSLQFFDNTGDAVHKIHLRPASNVDAFIKLAESLLVEDQSQGISVEPASPRTASRHAEAASVSELRERWSSMTDVHQFFGMLRDLKLGRQDAVRMVGEDYAWPLAKDGLTAMLHHVAEQDIPIMCFVGNRGCIQIHHGPVKSIKPMGPWINVLDETFHLHLRTDHVVELWGVRKPTKDGFVTSLEAYDKDGELIIQFFGYRSEGQGERDDWRSLAENLPRVSSAA
ncbi:MAG: hemin-degrading factor [Rhizobiaceae bacterium]